ncbi:MAG: tandem-95 repeat protein [Rivularia sp. (in: Bacteria)]|nr:tandem-95 repeat protein [Rivularia sp. MS3]
MNQNAIKIVTIGDSITQAENGYNSYRKELWELLNQAGYNVDFVGSENRNKDGGNFEDRSFDPDHEGHWGWRIDEIINGRGGQGKLSDWLTGYTPDIALIHLGSNDAIQSNSAVSSVEELKQVIDILRQDNPNVTIFLSQLIPAVNSGFNNRIQQLNSLIPGIVADENQTNSPVILVDQNSGFNANTDTYDGVHPDPSGEAKMAQKWFDALTNYFDSVDDGDSSPPPPANNSPSAVNDTFTVNENTSDNLLRVLENDSDSDGDSLAVSINAQPANGSLNIVQNEIFYTPDADFTGADTFTYQIDDGNGGTDTATVNLTVNNVNEVPLAVNDSATTNEDTAVSINVLENDSDADGDNLNIASVGSPNNGTTAIVENEIVYTPAANFNGVDSFNYQVEDGNGETQTATVTVNVAPVNDSPIAQNDAATTNQDTQVSIDVLANDTDVDGDNLTIASVAAANNGTTAIVGNEIVYTPASGFSGDDSFTYSIDDGSGVNQTAQVNVTVAAVNPTNPSARVNAGLLALYNFNEGSGNTVFDVSGVGTALNLEIDNLSRTSWGDGVLNINAPNLIASNGVATKLINGITATQEITLEAWVTPENRSQNGPARIATLSSNVVNRNFTLGQAGDDYNVRLRTTFTGNNGVGRTVSSSGGLLSTELTHVIYTREADGDAALYVNNQLVNSENIGGNLSNWDDSFRFALGNELSGDRPWLGSLDLFAVYNQAFDAGEVEQNFLAGAEDSASPQTPPNNNPANNIPILADDSVTTNEDTQVSINVLANDSDADGDNLNIVSVTSGSNGTTAIVSNEIVYTPAANFNGVDSFSYEVSDGNGGMETATVTVNVAAANDQPIAQNDTANTSEDTQISINVLANDSDADGDNLTIVSVADANNGTTEIVGNEIIYTPASGFSGQDNFTYSIDDGSGVNQTAQVNVNVTEAGSNNSGERVNAGLLALYNFNEGSGNTVFDVSGVGTALNLEIDNVTGVSWGDGELTINSPNLIASDEVATKLIDGITATQEITLEAWVTPGNRSQNGPARIASLSSDIGNRNFTLGQAGDDYNVRLRTTNTGNNGVGRTVFSSGGLLETEMTHVVYTRFSDGDAALYVDNQLVASENIRGDLSNWDDDYRLGIGNELTGDRPWLGSLDLFAVYNQAFDAGEVEQNFLAGSDF